MDDEPIRRGQREPEDRLVRAIYGELRRIAGGLMHRERPGHTLQPSALVHEALLRLLSGEALADVPDRRYLFAAAAQAMRQVLVDHARRRSAGKRERPPGPRPPGRGPGQLRRAGAGRDRPARGPRTPGRGRIPRPAQVVDLRFFGGLSVPEVAETLEVSDTTVEGDWRFARAWLRGQLGESGAMTPERGERSPRGLRGGPGVRPAGRAALLDGLCGGDAELRAEVERLLADDERAGRDQFLEPPDRRSRTPAAAARPRSGCAAWTCTSSARTAAARSSWSACPPRRSSAPRAARPSAWSASRPPTWSPRGGRRQLGRFELLEAVGAGAFGTVYKARDPQLDRIVAIKVPRAGNLADGRGARPLPPRGPQRRPAAAPGDRAGPRGRRARRRCPTWSATSSRA